MGDLDLESQMSWSLSNLTPNPLCPHYETYFGFLNKDLIFSLHDVPFPLLLTPCLYLDPMPRPPSWHQATVTMAPLWGHEQHSLSSTPAQHEPNLTPALSRSGGCPCFILFIARAGCVHCVLVMCPVNHGPDLEFDKYLWTG